MPFLLKNKSETNAQVVFEVKEQDTSEARDETIQKINDDLKNMDGDWRIIGTAASIYNENGIFIAEGCLNGKVEYQIYYIGD